MIVVVVVVMAGVIVALMALVIIIGIFVGGLEILATDRGAGVVLDGHLLGEPFEGLAVGEVGAEVGQPVVLVELGPQLLGVDIGGHGQAIDLLGELVVGGHEP